jgi:ATP-dependent Lon protease
VIQDGLQTVKKILAENYVRPDEAEKVKSTIRERGSYKIIDKVTVTLNESGTCTKLASQPGRQRGRNSHQLRQEVREAAGGGIWSIITMQYFFEEDQKGSPFIVET